ncbi:MAG TPA: 2-phosphosulfolactate phosphatase [Microbacterium sp.]|uniref:2-phosphosulfolactate phosphatase n=1 Tax=Microbacterium sp. TaxID=51671 RepID=UPI002CE7D90E|nr:2-phosphosulfolactate phosphatase [Microbacterium sp.]HWI31413.1 2-phosphosulfolactate phosphatase [Microbacterium sp.]
MDATPFDQQTYQVRLEWGIDGLARVAPADIVIVVDVLRFATTVTDAVEAGHAVALDAGAHAVSIDGAAIAVAAAESGAVVLLGCLRNAAAVAAAVYAEQERRGQRTSVAIIACGELVGAGPGAPLRFAIEDQLGVGAIVDALTEMGIDHTAPEAAVACESFRGLRQALRHLLTASGSGRELAAMGRAHEVARAAALDASRAVPVLRDGAFRAWG